MLLENANIFPKPFTYSLGKSATYGNLAEIARKNKEWRKVAKMIHRVYSISGEMPKTGQGDNRYRVRAYLCRATLDTKISDEAREEIYRLFGLTSEVSRCIILEQERKFRFN